MKNRSNTSTKMGVYIYMKQYSSYGCNIFACNILVKDGYDGILRQYEVLCTTEAITCITCKCCNNFKTVQGKTGRDQMNYHSHYNSFTAWPQHVISSHLTFHAVMQKIPLKSPLSDVQKQ